MDFYDLVICRHSERKFAEKKVKSEDIDKIINAWLAAPSGMNSQPWHFTIIQNKDVQDKLVNACKTNFIESGIEWRKNWTKLDNFNPFYSPDIIIVISRKAAVENSNEDCCFAIQNMVLMAESLGLSSCIIRDICWAINKQNQNEFGIPQEYDCFMCISIGYALNKNKKQKTFDLSKVNFLE